MKPQPCRFREPRSQCRESPLSLPSQSSVNHWNVLELLKQQEASLTIRNYHPSSFSSTFGKHQFYQPRNRRGIACSSTRCLLGSSSWALQCNGFVWRPELWLGAPLRPVGHWKLQRCWFWNGLSTLDLALATANTLIFVVIGSPAVLLCCFCRLLELSSALPSVSRKLFPNTISSDLRSASKDHLGGWKIRRNHSNIYGFLQMDSFCSSIFDYVHLCKCHDETSWSTGVRVANIDSIKKTLLVAWLTLLEDLRQSSGHIKNAVAVKMLFKQSVVNDGFTARAICWTPETIAAQGARGLRRRDTCRDQTSHTCYIQ